LNCNFSFFIFNFNFLGDFSSVSDGTGPGFPHFLHELFDHVGEPLAFGRRKPFQSEPFFFQTQHVEQLFCYFELLRSPVIAKGVMAISDVSPGPHDAVRAFFERPENVPRADPAGAHHSDEPHVGRILHPAHSGGICTGIRTPVAGEDDDSGIETVCFLIHSRVSLEDRNLPVCFFIFYFIP
jgi:hypothetical protein